MILRKLAAVVLWVSVGIASALAQTDTTPPTVPTGLIASAITINSFTLSWSASTDNVGVTGYEVFKGTVSLGTVTGLTLNVTGLAPNTTYAMKVRARDAAGKWSAQSTALSVKTFADTTPPAVPTGLTANATTATGFTLNWSATTDNVAVTGYEVFKSGVSLGSTTSLTKAITGLAPTTAYAITVRARDAVGNWSAQGPALTVTTLADTTAPSVPTVLNVSAITATGLTLKWTAASDNLRVTGYEIFRDGVSIGVTTAISKVITGLAPTTAYMLSVRARDAAGNWSAQSPSLAVTTLADTTAPSVPSGLTSASATISSFLFKWNASTDNVGVTGYEIFKDGVSYGTSATTSLSITGLALSTSYSMTVRSRDAAGNWSAQSAPRVITSLADTTPPSIPAGLAASAITINSFTLTWTASTDNVAVTAYEVFRGSVSLGTTTVLSINLLGLAPNTGYSMRVRARDAAGKWSAQSTALVVRTLADTTAPAIPNGLVAVNVAVTGLNLNWDAALDDVAVTAYEVFRNGVSLGTTATLSKVVTGLLPDTTYSFTVRARDAAANWSEQSAGLSVATPPDTTAPTVPGGLNATSVNVSSFTLKWTAATDDVKITGYEVFKNGVSLGVTTAVSKNITGLVPATDYSFTVRARDAVGNWSAESVTLAVSTIADTTPPAVPAGLIASSVTSSGFTLKWSVPADNVHVTSYEVFKDGVSLGTTTTATKVLTGLFPETEYAMTVRASDAAGNWSDQSLVLPVTTLADATAPSVPTGLVSSAITVTGFTLSWTASTDAVGVTLYEVFQDGVSVGTTAATTLSVTGLVPNTTYSLKVRASDAAGNWSAPSAAKSIKTSNDTVAPTVPTGLVAGPITGTAFTLSWTASTDNTAVTAYEVFRGGASVGTTSSTSLEINGLTLGATYSVKVRARDGSGNWSAQSVALSVTTYNDTTAPTVPDGLVTTAVTINAFTLTWNASTDDVAVTFYEVFKNGISVGTTAVPSFSLNGLALNTGYTMTVRARDANANWSALSAPLAVSTAADTTAPSAPSSLVSTNLTPTGFTVNWPVSTDDVAVTGYEVFVNGVSRGITTVPTATITTLPVGATYVVTVRARDNAGNWSDVGDPITVTITLVPFMTGFEATDGYQPGNLQGQNGWTVDGLASIVTTPVFSGQQAVSVAPTANLSLVAREFANTNTGVTFVDLFALPGAADSPDGGVFLETEVAAVALTGHSGLGELQVFDGNGAQGGSWRSTGYGPALEADGMVTAWQRITIRTDYIAKRWDLYLNGRLVAADIGFLDNAATSFTSLSLSGHAALNTGFDDVFIGFDNPLFTDADKDGMDDAWELANGLNPAVNDRNGDLDGDGVSNILEYLVGSGVNIPNTPEDADGDGLPDAWEIRYMGALTYGAATDPGGVGRTLLQSYQQGLSPYPAATVSTGLRGWYRADLGAIQDAAGNIRQWTDVSGHGFHGQQDNESYRPRPIPNQIKGNPALRFNGASNYIDLPNMMAGATAGEIFVVARIEDFSNSYSGLVHFGTGYGTIYSNGGVWNDFGTDDLGFYERPTNEILTRDHIINASISAAGDSVLRLNGQDFVMLTGKTVSFRADPAIGSDRYGEVFNGDIAEVLVYDKILTSVERAAISAYLTAKYAIGATPALASPTLTATETVPSTVTLTWSAPAEGSNVVTTIERKTGISGAFQVLANLSSGTSYVDSSFVSGTSYTYRVRISTTSTASDYSERVTVAPNLPPPLIPALGLRLWLRSDAGVMLDTEGRVTTWLDQSGLEKNAAQSSAEARPLLVPAVANGKPAVRFDGENDWLEVQKFMTGASEGELFVIVKTPGFAARDNGFWALGGADGTSTEMQGDVRVLTEDFGRNYRTAVGAPIIPMTGYVIYGVSAKTDDWKVRLNGFDQHVETSNTVQFGENGWLGRGLDKYLQGDIAEVIAYDHVLNATQRSAIQSYLAAKYAITAVPAPQPPVVEANAVSSTAIQISWLSANLGLSFNATVERQQNGGPFATIATLTDTNFYLDTGLTTGFTYGYRIKLANDAGVSEFSEPASLTLGAVTVPASGLRLWLKADVGVTLDANGGVESWSDQSAAHKDAFSTGVGTSPSLVENVANGRPVIRFDGNDDYLEIPKFMEGATEGELFVVVKLASFSTRNDGLWALGGSDGTWTEDSETGRILTEDFGRDYRTAVGAPITPLSNYVIYNVSAKTNEWNVRLNGSLQHSEETNTVRFGENGWLGRGTGNYLQGDIAEVVVYDRVLTAQQRTWMNSYLGQKYVASSEPDTDGDGMPDAWEIAHGLNPLVNDAAADPDGDGLSNIAEYRLGRNPMAGAVSGGEAVNLRVYLPR